MRVALLPAPRAPLALRPVCPRRRAVGTAPRGTPALPAARLQPPSSARLVHTASLVRASVSCARKEGLEPLHRWSRQCAPERAPLGTFAPRDLRHPPKARARLGSTAWLPQRRAPTAPRVGMVPPPARIPRPVTPCVTLVTSALPDPPRGLLLAVSALRVSTRLPAPWRAPTALRGTRAQRGQGHPHPLAACALRVGGAPRVLPRAPTARLGTLEPLQGPWRRRAVGPAPRASGAARAPPAAVPW
jgi:hypothetical protein